MMNSKIISILLLLLSYVPSWAQIGGDYNPSNPSDPGVPEQKYTLTLDVTPANGGSFNVNSTKLSAGVTYGLRAYPNTDFVFRGWVVDGDTLSTSTYYDYVMPARNVTVTGVFEYNPSSPSDPNVEPLKYNLSVLAEPADGGSFNTSGGRVAAGSTTSLVAYTNTDYVFKQWMIGETVISSDRSINIVMPSNDMTIKGLFEYNPSNPANPGSNYWNKVTGEVIVDDFKAGSLSSTIYSLINGSNSTDVTMITVAGRINSNDFGIANNYSNCTLIDFSRVTGVTEIPSYAFDYTNIESIYIPAAIEKIGDYAFYDCGSLSSLTSYAMTPPALGYNVFANVPEGLVVYVPAASIALYQEAEGWSKFTLLPIQEDIRSLTVSLPKGADAADYAKMWLELTNTKSGQRMHYVMTERSVYTFSNIIRNTTWNVVLRNERGDVFGQIDNVEVKDEDVSVMFSILSKPQSVVLSVMTPDGQDVTAQTQVTWTDEAGNYLAQAYSLNGLLPDIKIAYRVVLPQELAMQYVTPSLTEYTVSANGNDVMCQLEAIRQVQLTGKVKDITTKSALSGAVISASQTFGGKYSKTVSTKTDAGGNYTLTICNVPTSLAVAATDYISQTIVCDSLLTGVETVTVPEVSLKSITGAVISLGFSYTSSVASGEETDVQNGYGDYNNVSYSIFNKTKQQAINRFNVQYPQIVLLEDVEEGDVLELTATSKTSAFMPVTATATISAEQRADAAFNIVELGKIQASFAKNGNATVVGSLYDANGKLLKSYDYSNASLTISNLVDGNYTLVSMGGSKLFNSIYDLSQLPRTGLVLGSDYVQNAVEVKSGVVSVVSIEDVPTFDESKLYYTGDNTSFTVNKSSIVAGNYLTLTGRIDFKSAYATSVSNVNLIVDLPVSCSFVENSVMVGNSTSSYTLDGTRLTIPMVRYTDRVRFCVIPTLGGEYAPSAFAQFDLNGETITQPIGSANYTAKDLSITVPSVIAQTTLPVSGTAIGASAIEIYDGDVLIGQTTSLANGTWATICELNDPYNLSTHHIYAKVTTKADIELLSETKDCMYDIDAIEAKTVTMSFFNGWLKKQVTVIFDIQNGTTSTSSYMFYTKTPVSFLIDFNTDDNTKVRNVVLNVYTDKNTIIKLIPIYDAIKGKWIAVHDFSSSLLPVNVSVDYEQDVTGKIDTAFLEENFDLSTSIREEFKERQQEINDILDVLITASDELEEDRILNQISARFGVNVEDNIDFSELSEELISNYIATLSEDPDFMGNFFNSSPFSQTIAEYFDGVEIKSCEGLTTETLISKGFYEIAKTDGNIAYFLSNDVCWQFIDFESDVYIVVNTNSTSPLARIMTRTGDSDSAEEWVEKLEKASEKIKTLVEGIVGFIDECNERLDGVMKSTKDELEELYKQRRWLKQNSNNAWLKGEIKLKIAAKTKAIEGLQEVSQWLNKNFKHYMSSDVKVGKIAGKSFSFIALITDGIDAVKNVKELIKFRDSLIPPCKNAEEATKKLKDSANRWAIGAGVYYFGKLSCDVAEIMGVTAGITALVPSGGTSTSAILAAITVMAANIAADYAYEKLIDGFKNRTLGNYEKTKKLCEEKDPKPEDFPKPEDKPDPNDNEDTDPNHYDPPKPPTTNPTNPIHDPSGYVYEGVASNRIEGVIATAYYKETVEDMYGDLHENVVKWDASEYAQENPLFTDENGMYRWDVPQGLWQVKFEKEGYETAYSEWLPVPPPQLEVNIGMRQNRQPEVLGAKAYEDGVEVEFDKYMMPELLNTENIIVMQNNTPVEGYVKLLDEEKADESSDETYVSKVRFVASAPFTSDEVTLTVSNRVKSYAGIRMQDNYSQNFGVEQEIKEIVAEPSVDIVYGKSVTLSVSALPVSAVAGKKLYVKSSSAMIVSADTDEATFDENGKVEITASGELPGTATLQYSVEGAGITATTVVNVKLLNEEEVAAPTASIASGSKVEQGAELYLSCETEGAVIYYTTDGSCPCDETTRKLYDGTPIIIDRSMTVKAIAVGSDLTESEIAEFVYVVEDGTGITDAASDCRMRIYPLPLGDKVNVYAGGRSITNVFVTDMAGRIVAGSSVSGKTVSVDTGNLPDGVYVVVAITDDKKYSQKVVKVSQRH